MRSGATGNAEAACLRARPGAADDLAAAVRGVLESWERGDLAAAVRRLDAALGVFEAARDGSG